MSIAFSAKSLWKNKAEKSRLKAKYEKAARSDSPCLYTMTDCV